MGEGPLLSWVCHHDNGWVAHADERPDGTCAAWVALEGLPSRSVTYIEMDDVSAQAAAEFALRESGEHEQCSAGCSAWELHTHEAAD